MSRCDHGFAMQEPAPGQCVEKEVDCMDVNEICITQLAKYGWSDRIAARSLPRNTDDLNAVDCLFFSQNSFRIGKQRVERNDPNSKPGGQQFTTQIGDNVFQTTAIWNELPNDVHNQRPLGNRYRVQLYHSFFGANSSGAFTLAYQP